MPPPGTGAGSGKSGTPWLRMQRAYATACAILLEESVDPDV
ncbi:MAG TPA: hypothetical protein VN786_05165 [Acidimicrobiales bacterium]|nr:hypothetical protein [Acidimicrobiales bacterium]